MAIVSLVAGKGAPGVTTTALACCLSWGRRTVLAECDPAGGSILAGYLRGQLPGGRGLLPLAIAELRSDSLAGEFWSQLVDLDAPHRQRLLLPGLSNPAESGTLAPLWRRIAGHFAELEYLATGYDVIVDCGRLAVENPPWPLLWAADACLVVVQPTLASIAGTAAVVAALHQQLAQHAASASALGLVVVGGGPYDAAEVAKRLGTPVVAALPHDARSATVLTHGGDVALRRPLLRAAAGAETPIRALITRHRQQVPRRVVRGEVPGAAATV